MIVHRYFCIIVLASFALAFAAMAHLPRPVGIPPARYMVHVPYIHAFAVFSSRASNGLRRTPSALRLGATLATSVLYRGGP